MTFLNGILAFGAAAFVVPFVIHLLNRSRFRTVEWGAMHLLDSVIRINNKRVRIEQLILLLVRCAIPILLAFALARPVLTGWQALPGDAPASTIVLLDDSYSMDAANGDRPRINQAIDDACSIVGALSRGSDVSVVRMGGGPTPVFDTPVFDTKRMVQQLRLLRGGYGACEMTGSIDAALGTLANMANSRRNIILISDFQRADWETVPPATLERVRQQLDAMPIRPTVTLLHVGQEAEGNVSIDSLTFSTSTLGIGQDLQIRANLRNHGRKSYPSARVLFHVDGAQYGASQVSLDAKASTQVLFTHQFKNAGSHVVDVEVVVDDVLKTDNRYSAAVPVLERINVLLVDGAPSSEPLESETDFLAVALTPYTFGRAKLSDLIETRTVTTKELTELNVAGVSVVVLANVAKLSDDQVHLLAEYVRGGGSLLFFVGNKTDVDWHNRTLFAGAGGFLPMRIDALGGGSDASAKTTRIIAQHFDHPALQIFNERANGNLADAEIRQWYRLGSGSREERTDPSRKEPTGDSSQSLVLARLETGDPLIVERRFGDGIVTQVATACDADWSNLPMRPSYLPLVQQLVTTMASEVTPPRNIRTGESAVAILPGDAHGATLSLATPDGTRHTVRPAARGTHSVVEFQQTQQPGVYTLTGPDARPLHFVAQTSRDESDLRLLDEEHLRSLAADLSADLVSSSDEYLELDRTRRHGRETWRFLLSAALGLMFVELVLQQRFSRVKT